MRLFIFLLAVLAGSAVAHADNQRFIEVEAAGWIEAVPDELLLSVSVQYTGQDAAEVSARAEKTSAQIVAVARKFGIADDDIDSSRLSQRPEYEWRSNSRHYLGETVQRDIQLKVRNLDGYGRLIQQLTKLDLHQIRPPSLGHSKLEELQLAALENALVRGKRKAQTIANQVAGKLGPVIHVQELGSRNVGPRPRMMAAEAMSSDAGGAPVFSFGKQRINAQVLVRYGLQ